MIEAFLIRFIKRNYLVNVVSKEISSPEDV